MLECLRYEIKLILCWSFDEAAQYIQTFKSYENKTSALLEGKSQAVNHFDQASEILSSIRKINKNDAKRLLFNYGSLKEIILADYDEFKNIENIG